MVSQKRNSHVQKALGLLSNTKQTMVQNSYFSKKCFLKVALVMRLECILENKTDSVKAEDEILYI